MRANKQNKLYQNRTSLIVSMTAASLSLPGFTVRGLEWAGPGQARPLQCDGVVTITITVAVMILILLPCILWYDVHTPAPCLLLHHFNSLVYFARYSPGRQFDILHALGLTVNIPGIYFLLPLRSVKLEVQNRPLLGNRLLSKQSWNGVH